jgi:hypothetical protein
VAWEDFNGPETFLDLVSLLVLTQTAAALLERLTCQDISVREFFNLAAQLPDDQLKELSELLEQRASRSTLEHPHPPVA